MRHLFLPLAALLLTACPTDPGADDDDSSAGDDDDAVDPLGWPVDALGPFNAGWRAWDVTYTPVGGTDARTIGFNVWYPTEADVGDAVRYMDVFLDEVALGNAPAAAPVHGGTYPVMVYSHGFQGWSGTSSDLCRYFASHGWVVVAPDHTGNTLLDHTDPLATSHYLDKPQDVSRVLDELEQLPATDPLAGLADTSRVVVSGHSFGSYPTWAVLGATYDEASIDSACSGGGGLPTGQCTADQRAAFLSGVLDDARIVGSVPLAGTIRRSFFGAAGHRTVRGPVLFMSGTNDPVGQQGQWDAMDAIDFTWIEVEGACHQSFATGQCDTMESAEGFAIVDTYAFAFARSLILGDTSVSGILDGSTPVSDRVTFARKTE